MWLFLFICFLLGPSFSQLSSWLSGGGSLPPYIWILRLLLFGYESWILFSFPWGDAGCQLLWLHYIVAQRETPCKINLTSETYSFVCLSLFHWCCSSWPIASFTPLHLVNKACIKLRMFCKDWGFKWQFESVRFQGFSFSFYYYCTKNIVLEGFKLF